MFDENVLLLGAIILVLWAGIWLTFVLADAAREDGE